MFQTVNVSMYMTFLKCWNLPSRTSKKRREVGYRFFEFLECRQRHVIVTTNTTVSWQPLFEEAPVRGETRSWIASARDILYEREYPLGKLGELMRHWKRAIIMRNAHHVCWVRPQHGSNETSILLRSSETRTREYHYTNLGKICILDRSNWQTMMQGYRGLGAN